MDKYCPTGLKGFLQHCKAGRWNYMWNTILGPKHMMMSAWCHRAHTCTHFLKAHMHWKSLVNLTAMKVWLPACLIVTLQPAYQHVCSNVVIPVPLFNCNTRHWQNTCSLSHSRCTDYTVTVCKNTGTLWKLRKWSRGHQFVVHASTKVISSSSSSRRSM